MIFDDCGELEEILRLVLGRRYLEDRLPAQTRDEYNLAQLFVNCDEDFRQAVRTTKDGFVWLLNKIFLHPVFYSNSQCPQLLIGHQLALTLERLGSNGNGASVGCFSRNLVVGRGTVIKISHRVIQAINSLSSDFVVWPDKSR